MNLFSFFNKKPAAKTLALSGVPLSIIGKLPVAVFIVDPEGELIFGNERFHQLLDLRSDREKKPLDWRDFLKEEDRNKLFDSWKKENASPVTVRFQLPSGKTRWLEIEGNRETDEEGKTVEIIAVARDVTDGVELEKRAERDREMFKAILDSSPDLIFVKDAKGRYLMGNKAHLRRVGTEELEDVLGKTVFDFFSPERARQAFADEMEMIERGEPVLNLREDDEGVSYLSHKVPFRDSDGNVAGFVGISRDVTELREVEKALRQAKEDAEAGTRSKSEFLANMSHEIRTPMNAVIGMTGLLLDTPLTHEQRDFVETIRNSGDALLSIINDILDFSKIESGYIELERRPVDLRNCIEEALDILSGQASKKGLDLVYLIEEPCPAALLGDVTRLRQILVNLVSNAVKFTPKGEVFVKVSAEPLSGDEYRFHFSVKDSGIGIKKEDMDRLFRSFTQVDTSTTRKYGGTGLGLVISQRLVQLMGGELWCESEPGKGSTFHFTVVADVARGEPRVFFRSSQPQLEGKSLLIVDDNATNRQILLLQAKSWGMIPTATASGAEALALLDEGKSFDMVVLDWNMPDMDGLTLARKLQENPKTAMLPLVMLTSRAMIRKAEAEGVQFAAHLSKPVKASHLFDVFVEHFNGDSENGIEEEVADKKPDRRLSILLAEDNAVNQKVALLILRKLGHDVDVAGNGEEVLAALKDQSYDVILMDVQMPEMDGLEATRRIRELYQNEDEPWIIAMTANAMIEDRELCLEAGMNDYLSKPVKIETLEAALRKVNPTANR